MDGAGFQASLWPKRTHQCHPSHLQRYAESVVLNWRSGVTIRSQRPLTGGIPASLVSHYKASLKDGLWVRLKVSLFLGVLSHKITEYEDESSKLYLPAAESISEKAATSVNGKSTPEPDAPGILPASLSI